MVLVDFLRLIAENIWLYGGAFILVLSILVFVHEFGHYYVARRCGVRIDSFSIGFGRELFGITDKHGTRWKFSLIPLGGYVKMFGDTDPASAGHVKDGEDGRPLSHEERKVAFYAQPVAKRAAIVLAGPAINFIFAILVLSILYSTYGQPVTPPIGSAVVQGSAADKAGFQPHDIVLEIDGQKIRRFEDIKREVMVGLDEPRVFTVKRGQEVLDITAAPELKEDKDRFGFRHSTGLLGLISPGNAIDIKSIKGLDDQTFASVDELREALKSRLGQSFILKLDQGTGLGSVKVRPLPDLNTALNDPTSPDYNVLVIADTREDIFIRHNALGALFASVEETVNITTGTLKAIAQIVTGTRSATELGGIIRIGAIAGDMARAGVIALITFTALLSINLGLINLFPIPMLDGGHLLFYFIESLRGSPIPENIQEYAFRMGLVILMGIMVFANLNDIMQLIL